MRKQRRAPTAPDVTLRLIASDVMIRAALIRLRQWSRRAGAAGEFIDRAELLLAEILNNIAEHAYCGTTGWIELRCTLDPEGLQIDIRDWGKPLPRFLLRPPEMAGLSRSDAPLNTLPEGGFGWYLIHQLARQLHCHRENDSDHFQCYLPRHAD